MAQFSDPENIHPENDIERALADIGASEADDPDGSKRRAVLTQLALNQVALLFREPWEGSALPDNSAEPMYVSDGENSEQPMLALFTSAERAVDFEREHDGFENPTVVPGPWAIGSLVQGAGVRVNPNQTLGFRIVPELARLLRDNIAEAAERAQERARTEDDSIS
ncbi:MAG: hypothetical protein L0I62_05665 [Gammaproteobacteria bacterium]|nr:hypothetical protein [Gammaproteobacteria bacterium]